MELPSDFLRAKLAKQPPVPSFPEDHTVDDNKTDTSTETDSSTTSIQTVTPTYPNPISEPLPWTNYFSQNIHVPSSKDPSLIFNVYFSPPKAPNAPVYVFHHGAGSSALSFSLVAEQLVSSISCGVITFDVRHHGLTVIDESQEWDLRLDTLAEDEIDVVKGVAAYAGWSAAHWPDIIVVGHSLGGAVSAHIAANNLLPTLCLCVIDVVEGSAMDALRGMQMYLSTRPTNFDSLETGIRWHLQSRTVRNRESARVSVPPLLVSDSGHWSWRTDLGKTRPFWEDWFKGLSGKFLGSRAGKLLLLAGTDRLDKPLMIGQMQGKYQLMVFPDASHFLHEDLPSRTADALIELWRRNDQEAIKRVALLNKYHHVAAG